MKLKLSLFDKISCVGVRYEAVRLYGGKSGADGVPATSPDCGVNVKRAAANNGDNGSCGDGAKGRKGLIRSGLAVAAVAASRRNSSLLLLSGASVGYGREVDSFQKLIQAYKI